jgi:hypothetical protein
MMDCSRSSEGDGGPRKRIRTSCRLPDPLPVVGYHMVLVGPSHLTRPLATSLLQVSSAAEVNGWLTSDADILAVQALQRSLQYQQSCRLKDSSPLTQRHVHVYERLEDHKQHLPHPCHIVVVTQCTPQTLATFRQPLYQLPAVQASLASGLQRQSTTSVLVCVVPHAVDDSVVDPTTIPSSVHAAAVFTCWHPELEESRRTVARILWKRCAFGMRQGAGASNNPVSPMVVANLLAK